MEINRQLRLVMAARIITAPRIRACKPVKRGKQQTGNRTVIL